MKKFLVYAEHKFHETNDYTGPFEVEAEDEFEASARFEREHQHWYVTEVEQADEDCDLFDEGIAQEVESE